MRIRVAVGGLIMSLAIVGGASAAGAQANPYTSTPTDVPPATTVPEVVHASATPTNDGNAPAGELPFTGGDVAGLLAIGTAGVAGGAILLAASKRRTAAERA